MKKLTKQWNKDMKLNVLINFAKSHSKEIPEGINERYRKAVDLFEESSIETIAAEDGLTINKQFKTHPYVKNTVFLFNEVKITKVKIVKDDIFLTLDHKVKIVFCGAKIIEEETDIVNSNVEAIELYNTGNGFELHMLVLKRDKKFIYNIYYVTYSFKDLKFIN